MTSFGVRSIVLRLQIAFAVLAASLALGTVGFMLTEGLSFLDALYFCVVTVATVGYGDIHPTTAAGKLLAVSTIVTGVGSFTGVLVNGAELMFVGRQERLRQERLSMAIGLFVSQIGTTLLRFFVGADPGADSLRPELQVSGRWTEEDFEDVSRRLRGHEFGIDAARLDLEPLREFLRQKGDLLLRLLENPNLLEHEAFTDLLRAVFHLKEELMSRPDLSDLPTSDREHLAGDARRAYGLLARQWLEHLQDLKEAYPYLFSLAVRMNPFNEASSPIVR